MLFDRVEGLPLESGLKVRPSLVRLWRDLLEDYASEERHMSFLSACREQEALPFARMKYEEIGRLQGKDAVAEGMLARIVALEIVGKPEGPSAEPKTSPAVAAVKEVLSATVGPDVTAALTKVKSPAPGEPSWLPWVRLAVMLPFLISLALVIWGFSQGGNRNMVGAGIAIGVLSYGVVTGFLGGFSLKNLRR